MIGEFHAPWSSFLVVASDKCIEEQSDQLLLMLKVVEEQVQCFLIDPSTPLEISKQFHLSPENAKTWLSEQEWHHNHNVIHQKEIINAMNALQRVGIDMSQVKLKELFAPWITLAP